MPIHMWYFKQTKINEIIMVLPTSFLIKVFWWNFFGGLVAQSYLTFLLWWYKFNYAVDKHIQAHIYPSTNQTIRNTCTGLHQYWLSLDVISDLCFCVMPWGLILGYHLKKSHEICHCVYCNKVLKILYMVFSLSEPWGDYFPGSGLEIVTYFGELISY